MFKPVSLMMSVDVKGPRKAVVGYKIAPDRFKTSYRSVLTFEERKQSITHLFMHKTIIIGLIFSVRLPTITAFLGPLSSMFTFT